MIDQSLQTFSICFIFGHIKEWVSQEKPPNQNTSIRKDVPSIKGNFGEFKKQSFNLGQSSFKKKFQFHFI